MITIEADGQPVNLRERLVFSGGEVQPRLLSGPEHPWHIQITAHVWSSDDLMELLLVSNACHQRWPAAAKYLVLPYMPYGRQDRVCFDGEAFSLATAASIIGDLGWKGIEVWDPHSPKTQELLAKFAPVRVREAKEFVAKIPILTKDTIIVSPDEGAYRRAWACSCIYPRQSITDPRWNFIIATKARSSDTGELEPPTVNTGHIDARDFLIVDDICDGGRTFINLARVLRPLTDGKIYLYVTHGIFSAGFTHLREVIDHVYVANLHPYERAREFLTVLT